MNINKKLMRQWIEALRSRRFKQGIGYLRQKGATPHSVDRYCCLGVLCELVNKDNWLYGKHYQSYYYKDKENGYCKDQQLPSSVHIEIGTNLDQHFLISMNDSGKKFHEIADYLERTYLTSDN